MKARIKVSEKIHYTVYEPQILRPLLGVSWWATGSGYLRKEDAERALDYWLHKPLPPTYIRYP